MTTPDQLLGALGIYAGTFAVGAVSSIVPIVSIDVFLVAITLARGPADALLLIVLATLGQVIGKLPIYAATRAVSAVARSGPAGPRSSAVGGAESEGRQRRWVERIRGWSARLGNRPVLLLGVSALVGLPPFSLASTAAGVLGIRLRTFCAVISMGRAMRFALLIAIAARFGAG